MSARALFFLAPLIMAGLTGCEVSQPQYSVAAPPPIRDPLLTPHEVMPGRLEYAWQPDTFAPVLAQRAAYPTQDQANYAFERFSIAMRNPFKDSLAIRTADPLSSDRRVVRIHLFACRPGALNDTTGRIEAARGHVVHCATDFLDAQDRRISRKIVNFIYERGAWRMAETAPPTAPALWVNPEPSPKDHFSWLPWGRRTTPY
jgi:hypothetical protein